MKLLGGLSRLAACCFFTVLGAAGNLLAQTPAKAATLVSPNALRAYIGFLADDALEGRGTGARGGQEAEASW